MRVAVGSLNPVKIEATRLAFEKVWPRDRIEVVGKEIDSKVAAQPMSDRESIMGAMNRARGVLKTGIYDYGVGVEGGLQKIGDIWFDCGWAVVIDRKGRIGIASSARIETPQKIMSLIEKGNELGKAIDMVFGTNNAKQNEGHFGLMTDNRVTRTEGYVQGLIMALSRFMHPELFSD